MYPLIFLFLISGFTLVLLGLFYSPKMVSIKPTLEPEEIDQLKIMKRRFYLGLFFPFAQKFLEKFNLTQGIRDRLNAAHSELAPQEFFNIKLISMVVFGVITALIVGKIYTVWMLLAAVLGFIIPDIWAKIKINKRKERIGYLLPEVVDLLGLCVEAGLDMVTSIKWIIEKSPPGNPVLEELAFLLEEIRWGKQRAQALKDMAKRLNVAEMNLFVSTLLQSERMGTPIAEAFGIISEDARLQRFHRGERMALKAPIKILIPLVLCILPVIGIIIAGPIILQFLQGSMFQIAG